MTADTDTPADAERLRQEAARLAPEVERIARDLGCMNDVPVEDSGKVWEAARVLRALAAPSTGAGDAVREAEKVLLEALDDEEVHLRESEARRYELDVPFVPNPRLAQIAAIRDALAARAGESAREAALRDVTRDIERAMDAWDDGNSIADDSRYYEGWDAAMTAVRQKLEALRAALPPEEP